MNDLTIIIVSWNCRGYLADCLRSIDAAGSSVTRTIVVVDNKSNDGTREMLGRDFPRVQVTANAGNPGFAVANNQALKTSRSRYVMLLNPDTIVHPGALESLLRFMNEHPSVWAAGPAMLNRDGSPQRTGVRFPNSWNIFCEAFFLDRLFPRSRLFGRHKELYVDASVSRPVDYVQGACLIVRSEAVERVGGFDERFFMYFEETDWCYRMKSAGGQVYFFPDAEVTHFGGGDVGHYDEERLVHYHRGLLRFYHKHYAWFDSAIVRVIVAARSLLRIVVWGGIAVIKPGARQSARSGIRGYMRTFTILIERIS